jgi:hypothetical protein
MAGAMMKRFDFGLKRFLAAAQRKTSLAKAQRRSE